MDPGSYSICAEVPAFGTVTFYLIIHNPTYPVTALAFRMRMEPEDGYFAGWSMEDGWINRSESPVFDCYPLGAIVTGENIVMAYNDIAVILADIEIKIYIDPPEGADEVVYWTLEGKSVVLSRLSGMYPIMYDGVINPGWGFCYPTETENLSWTAVKTLYR